MKAGQAGEYEGGECFGLRFGSKNMRTAIVVCHLRNREDLEHKRRYISAMVRAVILSGLGALKKAKALNGTISRIRSNPTRGAPA